MNAADPQPAGDPHRHFKSWKRDGSLFADGGVSILMYHKLGPTPIASRMPDLYVGSAEFRRHAAGLVRSGLPCVPVADAVRAAHAGERGVCLSFDDGFCNAFDHAMPVLAEHGLRAIQFIVAGQIGGRDAWDRAIGEPPQSLMDDHRIRDWLAAGHAIGSHTISHPFLAALPPLEARAEIFDSRKMLEDRFGIEIRQFCYPYGDCNPQVKEWVAEAGYESACTTVPGPNRPGVHPWSLHRFMASNPPSPVRSLLRKTGKLIGLGRRSSPR